MESPKGNRRLAAILFTDIAGYTALMQEDEDQALEVVKFNQEVLERNVPKFDGAIHQFYGDGCLSIFSSATNAVACAQECQKEFLSHDPVVTVRAGIHIGEIYSDENKVYGDGVNVASRIESIGQPGTVVFSGHVYDKIRNHKEFRAESIGSFHFKNVSEPMQVYALRSPDLKFPDKKHIEGKLRESKGPLRRRNMLWLSIVAVGLILAFSIIEFTRSDSDREVQASEVIAKSIAVLPFNSIGAGSNATFSTGISEDILTQLSKIGDLKVISRTSSAKYANSDKASRIIARELGVETLLKGSVRVQGNKARISVQLVNPVNDSYIWAEDFDKNLEDVLIVQRDVAISVANALKIKLGAAVANSLDEVVNVDPEAYKAYQSGKAIMNNSDGTQEELERATAYFEEAIRIQPDFTLAHTGLCDVYLDYLFWHRADDLTIIPKARDAALEALSIDPNIGECYGVLGAIALYTDDAHLAEINLEKAIKLSPNYNMAYERLAWIKYYKNDRAEFKRLANKAIELDPLSTRIRGSFSYEYYLDGTYEEGIRKMEDFLKIYPDDNFLLWQLAILYYGNKDYEKAVEILESRTVGTHTNWMLGVSYAEMGSTEEAQRILDYHLERAKTGYVPGFMIGAQYHALGQDEIALDYLEDSFNKGSESLLIWGLEKDPLWRGLAGNPRFDKLTKKLRDMFSAI